MSHVLYVMHMWCMVTVYIVQCVASNSLLNAFLTCCQAIYSVLVGTPSLAAEYGLCVQSLWEPA